MRSGRAACAAIRCTPCPSTVPNVVRSESCRATSRRRARRSASGSGAPSSRRATPVLYSAAPAPRSSRNHSRRWALDSGSGTSRGAGGMGSGGAAAGWAPSSRARAATVRAVKTSRRVSRTPSSSLTRVRVRAARIESPPSSKKSSPAPTDPTPRTCAQMAARERSRPVSGAAGPAAACRTGAGSARRSILCCGVSGSAASTTTTDGTMWAGRAAARAVRSAAGSGSRSGSAGVT